MANEQGKVGVFWLEYGQPDHQSAWVLFCADAS